MTIAISIGTEKPLTRAKRFPVWAATSVSELGASHQPLLRADTMASVRRIYDQEIGPPRNILGEQPRPGPMLAQS
jgi:hypothetical protein